MSTETPTQPDELLTLGEVAALARVTEARITSYMRDESCPLREVRLGRDIRIPRSSYDAWLRLLAVADEARRMTPLTG